METTGTDLVFDKNEMSSPSGPGVEGATYMGKTIYENIWRSGDGEGIEGTNLLQ